MIQNPFVSAALWVRREFFPLRILDKYLFFDFLRTFLGTLVLLVSMIVIYEFTNNMKYLVSSKVDQIHVYLYILYNVPANLMQVVSPALMFSVCFVIGQFSVNKELVAMMVAGLSFLRIVTPILFFGFLVWICLTIFGQFVVIPANKLAKIEFSIMAKGSNRLIDFVYQMHIKGKNGFYYVYWIDEKEETVKGGFNYTEINSDGLPKIIVSAQRAQFIREPHSWKLYDVEEISFDSNLEVSQVLRVPEKVYFFPEDIKYFSRPTRNPEEMNFFELAEEIESRIQKGIPFRDVLVQRQTVFAMPFMSIIVVALGALAGAITKRSAGVASLGITIGVVLCYYIVNSTSRTLAENGGLPIWFGIWLSPVLFLGLSYYFYKKMNI